MCAVSNTGDRWRDQWHEKPWFPAPYQPQTFTWPPTVNREEFDQLKREVAQMREELRIAKAQDDAEGTPLCESPDKIELLRKIAELVGVSLDDVLGAKTG